MSTPMPSWPPKPPRRRAPRASFWEMSDTLLAHQGDLGWRDLMDYIQELELDVERFASEVHEGEYADRSDIRRSAIS